MVDESGEHIGTVDKVRGEKVIMTKNDPEAGGVHRSFTCSLLERVEGNKVTLTGSKDNIRRVIVGILDELGVDDPLARESRRRLASALY